MALSGWSGSLGLRDPDRHVRSHVMLSGGRFVQLHDAPGSSLVPDNQLPPPPDLEGYRLGSPLPGLGPALARVDPLPLVAPLGTRTDGPAPTGPLAS